MHAVPGRYDVRNRRNELHTSSDRVCAGQLRRERIEPMHALRSGHVQPGCWRVELRDVRRWNVFGAGRSNVRNGMCPVSRRNVFAAGRRDLSFGMHDVSRGDVFDSSRRNVIAGVRSVSGRLHVNGRVDELRTTEVEKALARDGVLLQQDKNAADVVGLITGEKLSSSWWSHPKGQEIFECLDRLHDHPDVLESRLIAGKVTFVHRRLWPEFLAVAQSGEPWQTRGLSDKARALLKSLGDAKGPAARELQERLLVHAEQVHTESGRHEIRLRPWSSVADVKVARDVEKARATIEAAVESIGARVASLPWNRFASR